MESSHPAWQTGVQFVLCRRRSPSSQVTFASICALCEEKWQCKQHTFALPMFTKKLPKCCSEKNITVGNGCLLDSMCQNSAVYSLHNQTGTKWPVSGLDLGIRFVEKLCDSDVDTHIIDVHPQKKIYMYYILFICTYM